MPNDMRERSGFTLIELLVVIAIIALLLAILMPALERVKKQSRAVACQRDLKQWSIIFAMYTDDNNGYFQRGWVGAKEGSLW
ncbi:MAG: prepilin-type N-terminal cleavage/methylation domain-containing protein [Phycisphaerales bacterium]|nr:MAG: prepilin-type N-terminal cleavage/methylation domain-containing protein [Phycisphaerales bacterium]